MITETDPGAGRQRCRWCGKTSEPGTWRCPECSQPRSLVAYGAVLLKVLILPLTLFGITSLYGYWQSQSAQALEDRKRLIGAYQDFGAATNALRNAATAIDLACLARTPQQCRDNLRTAIRDFDTAFDQLGPRLAPFNELSYRSHTSTSSLTRTWLRCYVTPYYNGDPQRGEAPYWSQMEAALAPPYCSADGCQPRAADLARAVVGKVYQGRCVGGTPAPARPVGWFHQEVQWLAFGVRQTGDASDSETAAGATSAVSASAIAPAVPPSRDSAPGVADPATRRTVPAWMRYNAGDYAAASTEARLCVTRYTTAAELVRTRIRGEPAPGVGPISGTEKDLILQRGELNDVATCALIGGWSAERLGDMQTAIRAYRTVSDYPNARTWDPHGWFWSPSEVARQRLSALQ